MNKPSYIGHATYKKMGRTITSRPGSLSVRNFA